MGKVFGEFLARARDREAGYLGSESLPDDEMLSSPPRQESLAEAPIHSSNGEAHGETHGNVSHAGQPRLGHDDREPKVVFYN